MNSVGGGTKRGMRRKTARRAYKKLRKTRRKHGGNPVLKQAALPLTLLALNNFFGKSRKSRRRRR